METDSYSANQRRAINLVWTACGDYQFEPQFLALKADGTPDFYMNCVIGLVRKWLGDEMPRRLFALWADDTRRSAFDDLAWLALENAVYEKELPVRPVLTELRRAHAAEFFASEYQLSRQEWMDKNQLVYSLQSAGGPFWGRSRRCSPRGKRDSPRPSPARARSTRTIWRPPSARRLRNTCNLTARPIKNLCSVFTSAISGRRCSPSSCRSRSSAPTS